jgi:hypothetical protein
MLLPPDYMIEEKEDGAGKKIKLKRIIELYNLLIKISFNLFQFLFFFFFFKKKFEEKLF